MSRELRDGARRAGLLVAAAWCLAPGVRAQQRPPPAPDRPEAQRARDAQRLDRAFLQSAAGHMRFQAQAARVVLGRSTSLAVLDLASDLASRHDQAEPELLRLLNARGMAFPMFTNDQVKALRDLKRLQGARLDRLFLEEVATRSAQADLAMLERAVTGAEDAQLRRFAQRQAELMREQLARSARTQPAPSATGRAGQRSL